MLKNRDSYFLDGPHISVKVAKNLKKMIKKNFNQYFLEISTNKGSVRNAKRQPAIRGSWCSANVEVWLLHDYVIMMLRSVSYDRTFLIIFAVPNFERKKFGEFKRRPPTLWDLYTGCFRLPNLCKKSISKSAINKKKCKILKIALLSFFLCPFFCILP